MTCDIFRMSRTRKKHRTGDLVSQREPSTESLVPESQSELQDAKPTSDIDSYVGEFSNPLWRPHKNILYEAVDIPLGSNRFVGYSRTVEKEQMQNQEDFAYIETVHDFTVQYSDMGGCNYLVKFTTEGSPLSPTTSLNRNIVSRWVAKGALKEAETYMEEIRQLVHTKEGFSEKLSRKLGNKQHEAFCDSLTEIEGKLVEIRMTDKWINISKFFHRCDEKPLAVFDLFYNTFMNEYNLLKEDRQLSRSEKGVCFQSLFKRIKIVFSEMVKKCVLILYVIEGYIYWIGGSEPLCELLRKLDAQGTQPLLIDFELSDMKADMYAHAWQQRTMTYFFVDNSVIYNEFSDLFAEVVKQSNTFWEEPESLVNPSMSCMYGVACAIAIKMFRDPSSSKTRRILELICCNVSKHKEVASIEDMDSYKVLHRGIPK